MHAFDQINTNALLARTEDGGLALESLVELLRTASLDSVQWFYLTAFLNECEHLLAEMREYASRSRPSKEVRHLLVESYLGVSS